MPPRPPGRDAPFAILNEAYLVLAETKHVMGVTATLGTVADVTHFDAMGVVVEDAVDHFQRYLCRAKIAADFQGKKRGAVPWIAMRQLTRQRRIFGIKPCEGIDGPRWIGGDPEN